MRERFSNRDDRRKIEKLQTNCREIIFPRFISRSREMNRPSEIGPLRIALADESVGRGSRFRIQRSDVRTQRTMSGFDFKPRDNGNQCARYQTIRAGVEDEEDAALRLSLSLSPAVVSLSAQKFRSRARWRL